MIVPPLYAAIPPETALSFSTLAEILESIIPRFFTVALESKYPKRPAYTLPDLELILTDKLEIACP